MADPQLLAFLDRRLFARLSTNGTDGYPHTVPIWYATDRHADGSISVWFISDRDAQKTKNALADDRGAAVIGGDPADGDGYLLRGRITVEDDPAQVRTHAMIDRYETGTRNAELRNAWKDDDIVVLRLHVERGTKVDG